MSKIWFTSPSITVGKNEWRICIRFNPYNEKNQCRFEFLDKSGRYAPGSWLDESAFPREVPKGAFQLLTLHRRKVDNLCPWL